MPVKRSAASLGFGDLALNVMLFSVAFETMAGTMCAPVLISLIRELAGSSEAGGAMIYGGLTVQFEALQLLGAPILGKLSDRYGRKPVILVSTVALAMDYALMGAAPSPPWLFAAQSFAGFSAGGVAAAYAYASDVVLTAERARVFGFLGAAGALGAMCGPPLGGLLAQFGTRAPFYTGALLALANAALIYLIVREPRRQLSYVPLTWSVIDPTAAFRRVCGREPRIAAWLIATFIFGVSAYGLTSLLIIYPIYRFGWSSLILGIFMTAIGAGQAVVRAGLLPIMLRYLRQGPALILGLVCIFASEVGAGLSGTSAFFCISMGIMCLGAVSQPVLLSIVSSFAPASDQGSIQGAFRSTMGLSALVGSPLAAGVFAIAAQGRLQLAIGAPYFVAAATVLGCGVLALRLMPSGEGSRF